MGLITDIVMSGLCLGIRPDTCQGKGQASWQSKLCQIIIVGKDLINTEAVGHEDPLNMHMAEKEESENCQGFYLW